MPDDRNPAGKWQKLSSSSTAASAASQAWSSFAAFVTGSQYRYALQLILSLCQLYGDTLYFATEIKENFAHGPYLHPLYFWFYFFFLNMLWIVIPIALIYNAIEHIAWCQENSDTYIDNLNESIALKKKEKSIDSVHDSILLAKLKRN